MGNSRQEATSVQHLHIGAEAEGQRLDHYLARILKGVPKSFIYRVVRKGEVRVNSRRVRPSHRLAAGDRVRVPPVRRAERAEPARPSDSLAARVREGILYEDDDLLVVDKPSGLAVHGGSGLRFGLIEVLRYLRPEEPGLQLVHRLDRETSGCLLIAKNHEVLQQLHQAMRRGEVDKQYLVLVRGKWRHGTHTLRAPLRKNVLESGERMVKVDPSGKMAETTFRPVRRIAGATLLEATLHTGRTHQIRVHAAHLGHPIAGDDKYGNEAFNRHMARNGVKRLFLHASRLRVRLPRWSAPLEVSAPLDSQLEVALGR